VIIEQQCCCVTLRSVEKVLHRNYSNSGNVAVFLLLTRKIKQPRQKKLKGISQSLFAKKLKVKSPDVMPCTKIPAQIRFNKFSMIDNVTQHY